MDSKCPVCQTDVVAPTQMPCEREQARLDRYQCRRCGDFDLKIPLTDAVRSVSCLDYLLKDDILKRAALSHWIRTRHESKKKHPADDQGWQEAIVLDRPLVESIIKTQHPSPKDQAASLVRWTGDNSRAGEVLTVDKYRIEAIVGSADPTEFGLVFEYLKDQGTITGELRYGGTGAIRPADIQVGLSFPGWERYQELKRVAVDSRKAFMAMEYGHPDLESLFRDVWKPAVKQTGFDLFILPERPKAGLIDDRLRVEIRTSRFLIADLTHENRGAYWEAGYAEGLGRPVIYMCEKKKFKRSKTHFDTNHHETVLWDPESPQEAAEKLKTTIRAELPAEAKLTDD